MVCRALATSSRWHISSTVCTEMFSTRLTGAPCSSPFRVKHFQNGSASNASLSGLPTAMEALSMGKPAFTCVSLVARSGTSPSHALPSYCPPIV
eukprot:scaffold301_cov393-Prasinococcus_capsulatus_cf.AAC.6